MLDQDKIDRAGVAIDSPTRDNQRVDFNDKDWKWLYLFLLSAANANLASIASTGGGGSITPEPVIKTVENTEFTELADGSVIARKVSVYNNSANDIAVIEGDAIEPGFNGQDALTTDQGIILEAGDYFESPVAHIAGVFARCRDGQTAKVTVTEYAPV